MLILSDSSSLLTGWLTAATASQTLKQNCGPIKHINVTSQRTRQRTATPELISLQGNVLLQLQKLGITESILHSKARATPWLANKFSQWNDAQHNQFAGLARSGVNFGGIPFSHYFARLVSEDKENTFRIEQFSLNTLCAQTGVFTHPVSDPRSILSSLEYGLTLSTTELSKLLEQSALANNVEFLEVNVAELSSLIKPGESQSIVDCRPERAIDMPTNFKLPVNQINVDIEITKTPTGQLYCEFDAQEDGFVIAQCVSGLRQSRRFSYSDTAPSMAANTPPHWDQQTNTLFIGDSGISQVSLDLGLDMKLSLLNVFWPLLAENQKPAPLKVEYFNRRANKAYSYLADMALLPFILARRADSQFWREINGSSSSDELNHLIDLFCNTGVLPSYEHYRENSHEIENILLAFDYVPSGYDPLTQHMSEEELTNSMRQLHNQLVTTVKQLPAV